MTRLLNQGQGELLRLLVRMPFLDRLELAALAGRSRGLTGVGKNRIVATDRPHHS